MSDTVQKIITLLLQIAKEQNLQNPDVEVKPISTGGANYTSILYLATITSKNKADLHLFVKVAAMGEKIRDTTPLKLYDIEKYMYTDLKAAFRILEEKYRLVEIDRLRMSKYYGASSVYLEEMLVLENLSSRGFVCHDRMKSVDWDYAKAATSELTKLHALSIAYDHHQPEEFAKTLDILNYDVNFNEDDNLNIIWNGNKQSALDAVRVENKKKLKTFLDYVDLATFFAFYRPGRRQVLGHGDFRPSNLMHRKRDDGSMEVIPVDYQTIRASCPIVDLLYFIFTGTDAEFRKKYYEKLIEHYYSELRAAMTRLGLNPDEKYSKDDFEFELKERLPFGLAVAVFTLPIVTVEAENAPKVDADLELADFSIQKTGSLYPERMNGVVDDYVRWGIL